jgi:glutamine amidotransferase
MKQNNRQIPVIGVIDYGMGNLGSVAKALTFLGFPAEIVSDPDRIASFDRLVLPGVGAMSYAMHNLGKSGLDQAIRTYVQTGRPFLGICLGMQLMFDRSEEGDVFGLGIIPGIVRRFPTKSGLKIPHMGWNQIADSRSPLIKDGASFYFVHSYYACPQDERQTVAFCEHGLLFSAAVQSGSILLTQFHPEKSGETGLELLSDWVTQDERRLADGRNT